LPDDLLQTTMASALSGLAEEYQRTRHGFEATPGILCSAGGAAVAEPDRWLNSQHRPADQLAVADPLQIWRMLPALKHLPEEMLNQLSRAEIFMLNSAFLKESKVAGKLQANARLTQNAQHIVNSPIAVPAGTDDRKDRLHCARFLGGASCSAQALWLQAREFLGPKGVTAIGNYDLDSIGCGGCVTPRGWLALHDPSSSDLKLKLFHMPNVSSSTLPGKKLSIEDGESVSVGDSLREIADMDALRAALNTLREAMASALPWNRSISAIVGFMSNSNYCAADLKNNPKRAAILTEFIDYAIGRNSLNWENKQGFLSTDDLAHAWTAWKAKRAVFFGSSDNNKGQKGKGKEASKKDDICRKYNTKEGCPHAAQDCRTLYGIKLRHVCNQFIGGGEKCEKDHPRPEHK
jgi:hypothetical protein